MTSTIETRKATKTTTELKSAKVNCCIVLKDICVAWLDSSDDRVQCLQDEEYEQRPYSVVCQVGTYLPENEEGKG